MRIVLDTSVAIAWYLNEPFSFEARRWQTRCAEGRDRVMVPTLHYQEFANVLRTYTKRGELDPELAEDIYGLHCEAPLEVTDPPRAGLLKTAYDYDATAYDAAYILLALTVDARLLTAERTTTPWVVKLGERVTIVG
ncbi:type II toxin-antitoxin system VapC family toxin [Kiritimatiella glycovorans]|uniref:Putative nucleic acid-binding protein, contains PIN domain n=1 Tax=Kiritimatiella glycovorans TaxID=1307763 RepID=A0A0G3EEX2_9BACT|nr:type II toxin-antitoxin system VapC family toxin [Kiritimatiella glycovorans]AKJ65021.1 putative nucleic acid-binding protein, contains PIN domain [Kiritimatiella glycovorans]